MELFVPKNPIETAQELQWEIDMAHPEVAPGIAQRAIDVLGDVRKIHESNHLFIHTLGALILDRGRSRHESMPWHFNEITVKGFFGGINYVQGNYDAHLQTLVVDLFDVEILQPDFGTDSRLKAPLAIPVNDIQSVLIAG